MEKEELKEDIAHGSVNFPLATYRWNSDKRFVVDLHWHDETELIYFKKGKFTIHINMKEYKVLAPAFVFISAGDIHSIVGEEGCRESVIVFDLKMLSFEYFDGIQYKIIRPLLEGKIQFPQFVFTDDEIWKDTEKIYKKILQESKEKDIASFLRVKGYFYQLIALLYENKRFISSEDMEYVDIYKVDNVKKVLSYIHNNYSSKITTEDLSSQVAMNPQYFCRYFKKLIGKTPTEYINDIRITKAAELLLNSNMKIIDIAISCGYDNISYFIKRFKKEKHISPSEYRKSK